MLTFESLDTTEIDVRISERKSETQCRTDVMTRGERWVIFRVGEKPTLFE